MSEDSKAEVLRTLGLLVRALTAMFWGLPLTLVAYVQTAQTDWMRDIFGQFGMAPALVASGTLIYGLSQLRHFQPQERVWQQAVHVSLILAIVNAGLSPFLFWWHRLPVEPFYVLCVRMLLVNGVLLLAQVNRVLHRLSAMLPDETLRSETAAFTSFDLVLLAALLGAMLFCFAVRNLPILPSYLSTFVNILTMNDMLLLVFSMLIPLAVTMSLLWKTKEVIFTSVFGAQK